MIKPNRYFFTDTGTFDYKNPDEYNESQAVYVIFARDSSLFIKETYKTESPTGGHYYKTNSANIYKIKTNPHGDKYIKAFHVTHRGWVKPVSSSQLGNDRYLYRGKYNRLCHEMTEVIDSQLSRLMGIKFDGDSRPSRSMEKDWYEDSAGIENTPEWLLYPFLRKKENVDFFLRIKSEQKSMTGILNIPWQGSRGLPNALKNSNSIEGFIRKLVYSSAVKAPEDIECLEQNPSLIKVFNNIDLKMGASEAHEKGYAAEFLSYHEIMLPLEVLPFKLFLSYMPKDKHIEVFDLLTRMTAFRRQFLPEGFIKSDWPYRYSFEIGKFLSFSKKVPISARKDFVSSFFEEYQKSYLDTEVQVTSDEGKSANKADPSSRNQLFVDVIGTFTKAYTTKYLTTLPTNSFEKCKAASLELFGIDLVEESSLTSYVDIIDGWDVTVEYVKIQGETLFTVQRDFVQLLMNDVELNSVDVRISSPNSHVLRNVLKASGTDVILSHDLHELITKHTKKIDTRLLALGQKVTPENRLRFLRCDPYTRKFKINWKYLTMDIPMEELLLYKKAGIKSKQDIKFWMETKASLPKETYSELLNDQAFGASTTERNGFDFYSY